MKIVVIGLGVQGKKRFAVAGKSVMAIVDPIASEADFSRIEDVPLESYDAACVCVPDSQKLPILRYLLSHKKHVLVEKPVLAAPAEIQELLSLSRDNQVACYTAYNHRFEPHIVSIKKMIERGEIGEIYLARFFYGNGTARDVRNSPWRDAGPGVLADLGSHLLDMAHFLFGPFATHGEVWGLNRFENKAPDHVLFGYSKTKPVLEMEATFLSWRNSFSLDLIGELGSAHIDCLCKWGPSTLTIRKRIFPSGRPEEKVETLTQSDPTWQLEWDHFLECCRTGATNLENDLWLHERLSDLQKSNQNP